MANATKQPVTVLLSSRKFVYICVMVFVAKMRHENAPNPKGSKRLEYKVLEHNTQICMVFGTYNSIIRGLRVMSLVQPE